MPEIASNERVRRPWLIPLVLAAVAGVLGISAVLAGRQAPAASAPAATINGPGVALAPSIRSPQPEPHAAVRRLEDAPRAVAPTGAPSSDEAHAPLVKAWNDAMTGTGGARPVTAPALRGGASLTAPVGDARARAEVAIGQQVRRLSERVPLSAEQTTALTAALRDEQTQVIALAEQSKRGELSLEQAHARIAALRTKTDAQLEHVLSPAQIAALKTMRGLTPRAPAAEP